MLFPRRLSQAQAAMMPISGDNNSDKKKNPTPERPLSEAIQAARKLKQIQAKTIISENSGAL